MQKFSFSRLKCTTIQVMYCLRIESSRSFRSHCAAAVCIFSWLCSALLPAGACRAEEWSVEPGKQHPASAPENRIIKWCSDSGSHVRYASANLQLKGYSPCGMLNTAINCDASGKRLIGSAKPPAGFLDCAVGPRIVIERTDGWVYTPAPADQSPGMSAEEKRSLKKKLDQLTKHQRAQDPLTQFQPFLNLIAPANGGAANQGKSQNQNPAVSAISKLLGGIDPQTEAALNQLLGAGIPNQQP